MTNSTNSQRRQGSNRAWLPSLLLLAQFLSITPVLLIVFADEQQRQASDAYVTLLDQPAIPPALRGSLERMENAERGVAQRSAYLKVFLAGACLLAFGVVFVIRRFRTDATVQRKLEQELRTTNEEVIAALAATRQESEAKNQVLAQAGRWLSSPLTPASLSEMAAQLVAYAEIESGAFALQSVDFEPSRIAADLVERFRTPAESKGLILKSVLGKGLSGVLRGDPVRLRQVMAAFVDEAICRASKGDVVLRADAAARADGRTSLRFDVRVTGSEATGPGLRLTIAKKLLERMGGQMEASGFTAVFESAGPWQALGMPPILTLKSPPTKRSGRERRAEPRQAINYPTLLRSEEAGVAVIRILDVSRSGLRVSLPFRLDIRTEVEIRIEGLSVVGEVRNCTCIRANEFHVGIAVRPPLENGDPVLHHLRLLRINDRLSAHVDAIAAEGNSNRSGYAAAEGGGGPDFNK